MSSEAPILIIGAGPTGLGAALRLMSENRRDWVLVERDAYPGGLSASFKDEGGYTWDLGGHVVFSHYDEFTRLLDDLLGSDGYVEHQRESWIRMDGAWVPYPFQNNLHRLAPETCAACLEGLIRAALDQRPSSCRNFEEFLLRTYGQGIADVFMLPYNRKVWACEPADMDVSWVADRLAVPDPGKAARNAVLGKDDVSWGPNSRFRFPLHGGTGAIWRSLAQRLPADKIVYGAEAVKLDVDEHRLTLVDGRSIRYGHLLSTMPLHRLARASGREDWQRAAAGLRYSSAHVIGVGLEGSAPEEMATKCWMYFPDDNCPFYRVTHFSRYSQNNVDDIRRHWSLMAEVSASPTKHVDETTVVEDTIQGMLNSGLIGRRGDVVHTWHRCVDCGYPTPALGRDAALDELLPALKGRGIYSRGRFGAWKYEVGNMDHSFMQGWEAVGNMLHATEETTLLHPDVVNQRRPVQNVRAGT